MKRHAAIAEQRQTLIMDPRARIAKNTAALLILRVITPLLSVAVVLAVARRLGTEGLGRYTLAFTFLYFFNTVAPLGIYALITRDGARDRAHLERLLANAMTLGTVSSLFLAVTMAALGLVLHYDDPTRSALGLLSLAIFPCTLGSYFEAAFAALERMEYIAISAVSENLLKVGAGVGVLLLGYGLDAVIVVAVAGRLLACLVSVFLLSREGVPVRWAIDGAVLRALSREAPTFLLISIFATLYWRIDVFMLSQLRGVEDVGQYGAAWRLLELGIVVPQSFCHALYPQMAQAVRRGPHDLAWLGKAAARYLFVVSLPAAVCATVVAGPILALLYGEPFRTAGHTLSVLIWTVVPYGWVRYHAYVLVAADRQRIDLALNVLMSIVNVLVNLLLIPAYGHLGAALATFVSVCVYGLVQYGYLLRHLPGHAAPIRLQPAPLLAAAIMGTCVWLLREENVLLGLGLAPMVYGGTLLAVGFFSPSELRLLHIDRVIGNLGLVWRLR